jgi:hypothetical protein
MRREYDFKDWGPMVRGKYFARATSRGRMICIAPDVAKVFPDEAAVNNTLRQLVEISRRDSSPTRRATRRNGRGA